MCALSVVLAAGAQTPGPAAQAVAATAAGDAALGARLLERAFRNLYADDYIQTLVLADGRRGGRERRRELQIIRKQSQRPGKALVRFTAPASIRRTSVLVLENEGASDDLYVYLPAIRRTKHLSSAQRADSFFGTDLSYEDVEPKRAADFEAVAVGAGSAGEIACTRVVATPRPDYVSAYERMELCIEPERGIPLWIDFHSGGKVAKRLSVDPASVRAVGDAWIPFEMTMERTATATRMSTRSYELRPEIPDTLFNTWNLEAGDDKRDRARID